MEHSALAFKYTVLPTAAVASFEVLGEGTPTEAAAAESAKQSLSWLAVFPTAPVGVGARWRIETSYVQAGTPVTMTVTSELVTRTGTHAAIHGVVPTAKLTIAFTGTLKGDTEATVTGDSTMTLTPRR